MCTCTVHSTVFHYIVPAQFDFDTRSLNSIQNGNRINKGDFGDIMGYSSEVSHRSVYHHSLYVVCLCRMG